MHGGLWKSAVGTVLLSEGGSLLWCSYSARCVAGIEAKYRLESFLIPWINATPRLLVCDWEVASLLWFSGQRGPSWKAAIDGVLLSKAVHGLGVGTVPAVRPVEKPDLACSLMTEKWLPCMAGRGSMPWVAFFCQGACDDR
jgi:hypothetical protein